ncbi:MAG: aminoacyl-tRNA hydrolase [Gammaproteobacteria bacterium]
MAEKTPIRLIVGLGNPGEKYAATRHNAGFQFVDAVAARFHATFRPEKRFFGDACRVDIGPLQCHLLKPATFMNRCGQSVASICHFYKLSPAEVLVVHDDLDLQPGVIRLKRGGGHGGHNGLRDIHKAIGADYQRLRIGIGHPGDRSLVVDYVLKRPSREDDLMMSDAIARGVEEVPAIVGGELQKVMNRLH